MRVPNENKLKRAKYDSPKVIHKVKSLEPFTMDRVVDLSDDKSKESFINYIKNMCRRSIEYKSLMETLKEELDMNKCIFFKNVDRKKYKKMKLEVHHTPFSMYELIEVEVQRFVDEGIPLNPLFICNELMKLHYEGKIGLVPLSSTVHELVHSGKLFVPVQYVLPNVIEYYRCREKYMSKDLKKKLEQAYVLSNELSSFNTSILDKKYVYIEVEGFTLPSKVD